MKASGQVHREDSGKRCSPHILDPPPGSKGDNETAIVEEEMRTLWIVLLLVFSGAKPSEGARVFTIVNECKTTIWPGIIPGESFNGGGFALKQGQSVVVKAPVGWSGRIWGRTGCNFDRNGNGSCQTGSCGSSLKCSGSGETPATLAEFTLAALDFYDVSLVDGFNLPVVVTPVNAQGGNCSSAGCDGDLRQTCPSELAVMVKRETVACRSACDVFDTDQYCCRGVYGNPSTCQPTYYSKKFKTACPAAYSYAYDDPSSIFTCSQADYIVTFCSNRKNRVCSYHDNRLTCSGTEGGASTCKWLIAMFLGLWGSLLVS
ncbi:pathogenesis-related thaumatin-like protein 3.5 isoform X1 [Musa acuminata AAA Group]|uniref:pathogenesis-related thaumatin-like protein 3.5 isoform X1 n=1 Tax=Musa acuminata AAA Group TaxID=214697 RepID=UPI0031DACA6F